MGEGGKENSMVATNGKSFVPGGATDTLNFFKKNILVTNAVCDKVSQGHA